MSFEKVSNILKKIRQTYYPVGSYVITKTNVNPRTFLKVGTWELKDKRLDLAKIPNDVVTFNTTNTQNGSYAWFMDGRCLQLKLQWITKVAYVDGTIAVATVDFSKLEKEPNTLYPLAGLDRLGFIPAVPSGVMCNWGVGTGEQFATINIKDVIHRQGTRSFTNTSYYTYLQIPIRIDPTFYNFKDQLCNQFYWLRVE